jgi:hypothetical protein
VILRLCRTCSSHSTIERHDEVVYLGVQHWTSYSVVCIFPQTDLMLTKLKTVQLSTGFGSRSYNR